MIKTLFLLLLCVALSGCSYTQTLVAQMGYALQQQVAPEQRTYKHMLDRETFFVFGRIEHAPTLNPEAVAVVAVSDRFSAAEVVDVSHVARADSYYGLNLPAGEFRLLVVSDLDRNGVYDQTEVIGERSVTLSTDSVPDKVLSGCDLNLASPAAPLQDTFHVAVCKTFGPTESLFYPQGTIRTLDDPIFSPQMASLGMYAPAVFLETAPMMFYALEEDCGYKVPVVFVHGIGGSARDFADMVAALDRSRYRPWFFHYPSGSDLKQLGALFYKIFLSGEMIRLGDMPMVIVAHSMGGLVVREALNLTSGAQGESQVRCLITLASPLGGHPAAQMAEKAPLVLPSWRDVNPDSAFIAGLHRKPLPEEVAFHLLFAYGDDRALRLGANSDGVVPLTSQLDPLAQKEAVDQRGFDDTHTGILHNPAAIQEVVRLTADVRPPYPESHLRELLKGGFTVELGPRYTPVEAYCIHTMGHFMKALTTGVIPVLYPAQDHFIQAVRGEIEPNNEMESAWLKFIRDYPDWQSLTLSSTAKDGP